MTASGDPVAFTLTVLDCTPLFNSFVHASYSLADYRIGDAAKTEDLPADLFTTLVGVTCGEISYDVTFDPADSPMVYDSATREITVYQSDRDENMAVFTDVTVLVTASVEGILPSVLKLLTQTIIDPCVPPEVSVLDDSRFFITEP